MFYAYQLPGELRLASAAANRLQALGALTQGDRHAGGAGGGAGGLQSYALDGKYGWAGLAGLYRLLRNSHASIVGPALAAVEKFYGGDNVAFADAAISALQVDSEGVNRAEVPG